MHTLSSGQKEKLLCRARWENPIIRRTEIENYVILSRGDRLNTGTYILHSSFSKAVNYINGHSLVSLVSKEAGNGPVNVVLDSVENIKCNQLAVSDNYVDFSGQRHYFTESDIYNSKISIPRVDEEVLKKNLSLVSNIIKKE